MFFFYVVIAPISTTSVYEVPAIRVNTTKSTYTFTSEGLRDVLIADVGNYFSFSNNLSAS